MQNYFPCCVLCKGNQYFRSQQYKFPMCPQGKKKPKKPTKQKPTKNHHQQQKIMLFQIASLIQCASAQPFIPKGYSFESVSKSEPLMRIIKYAVGFAHK